MMVSTPFPPGHLRRFPGRGLRRHWLRGRRRVRQPWDVARQGQGDADGELLEGMGKMGCEQAMNGGYDYIYIYLYIYIYVWMGMLGYPLSIDIFVGYGNMKMVDLAPQPTTIGIEWDTGYVWDERKNLETPPNGGFQNHGGTPKPSKVR